MDSARLVRRSWVAVLILVTCVGTIALIASPFVRNPMVPLLAALGISFILVLSVVSLSRRDPVAVLTVMLAALFLVPGGYVVVGPLKSVGNPAELVGLLALMLWAAARILGLLPARPAHPVRWVLLAWAMTALMAFAAAMMRVLHPEESAGAVRALFPLAAVMGIALLAVDGLRTREMVERTLFRLVVLGGVSAAIGVVEFGLGFQYRTAMRLPGLTTNSDDYIDTRAGFVRIQAGASHPIEYAVVLAAVAPLALHFALRASRKWQRGTAWLAFIAILTVTPMTVSRSGMLGLTVAMVVYGVHLGPRERFNGVIAGLVGLAVFRAAVPGILGTIEYFIFAGSQDSSITARTEDYARIPWLVTGHEVLGRGFGTFAPTLYFFVDNQYLLTLLEGGLVSVAVMIATFVVGMGAARGYRKRSTDEAERSLGQALAAAVAAVAVAAVAFDEFSFRQTFFTFALLLGCSGALWSIAKEGATAAVLPAVAGAERATVLAGQAPLPAARAAPPAELTSRPVGLSPVPAGLVADSDREGWVEGAPTRADDDSPQPLGASPSVAFAFAYHTWADAARRDFSWSADQMAVHLLADSSVLSVVVSDPLRSRLSRVKRHDIAPAEGFPRDRSRTLVRPFQWRRHDAVNMSAARAYSRFDRWLSRQAPERGATVLVTCHPVHAAVADRRHWRDVVYYAWDDWLEYPPFEGARPLYAWSYAEMTRRDVHVIGVSQAVVHHVGAARSTVVPNGVSPDDYRALPPAPTWFSALRRPLAFYAGALERRVDVDGLVRLARDLPDWTVVLVGPMHEPELFHGLSGEPNVHVRGAVPRQQVLAMAAAADVCLIPHRETPMSRAMSPLKLYEYLGAGTPVVATDLPPMRGVSERCILVSSGEPMAPAIRRAAAMPPQSDEHLREFFDRHSWDERYATWRRAALGFELPGNES